MFSLPLMLLDFDETTPHDLVEEVEASLEASCPAIYLKLLAGIVNYTWFNLFPNQFEGGEGTSCKISYE